ncbi:MAG: RNA-binding protein [Planctomycetota bacterium]|nr:RNA-binding protein [Planctomycetota bacterium]
MSNKVYVGNLPYSFTNDDLRNLFAAYGVVRLAEVILDRTTNRSRGFGFVELGSAEDLQQVIRNLHDTELQGRRLTVTEARERAPGGPGGAPRDFSGSRSTGGGGFGGPRPTGGGRDDARSGGGGGGHGASRPSNWGGGSGGPGGGRGGSPHRGGGRARREEGDRWSDGGPRRRRHQDDFGDD